MFISLGYLSTKMLVPLLIPILYSVRHRLSDNFDKKLYGPAKHRPVFLNTFLISISFSINFVLFIIEYKRSRSGRKKIQDNRFDNQLIIEKTKMKKKQKKYRIIFLILLPLFNFFNYLSYDITSMFKPKEYNKNYFYTISIPIYFIVTAFMSYFFLNYKFYIHQKTSMIITPLLSLFLLAFLIILNNGEKLNNTVYSVLFLVKCLGLKSLRYVLYVFGKVFMDKLFVTHIKLMTFLGLFGIVFSLIANAVSFYIDLNFIDNTSLNDYFINDNGFKRFKNIFDDWGNYEDYDLMILIVIIILLFAENYIIWFCIYTFSPNHFTTYSSINAIAALIMEIYNNISTKNKSKEFTFFICISSILALFGVFVSGLIFNEILIIRICKMDKYTNVEINRRQKEETQISMVNYNSNISNKSCISSNNEFPETSFDSDNFDSQMDKTSNTSLKSD